MDADQRIRDLPGEGWVVEQDKSFENSPSCYITSRGYLKSRTWLEFDLSF